MCRNSPADARRRGSLRLPPLPLHAVAVVALGVALWQGAAMNDVLNLVGRLLIAALFLAGALQKAVDPAPVQGMLAQAGLAPWFVWPVALFDAAAVWGLVVGPRVRLWALALALYCAVTSAFHFRPDDPWQMTIFVKNWAIAGGLLILASQGPGRFAWRRRRAPVSRGSYGSP